MLLNEKIDVLDFEDISNKSFYEDYILQNKPAIIKGMLEHVPAGKLWTLERLQKRLGHLSIKVFNNNKKNGTSFIKAHEEVLMKNMLDLIQKNSASDYRMFVNPVLKNDKELAAELPCPDFFKGKFQLSNLMFLGGKGSVVPMHYDFMKDDGLLTHLFGRKDVILLEPNQAELLYRLPFNTTSLVNIFEPDYETYPALKKVNGIHAILEHGDTLYIPSGYWHQLKYVDASMSIAFRKWHTRPSVTLKTGVVRLFQIPFDKSTQALLGNKWLSYKKKVARRRAQKVMKIDE